MTWIAIISLIYLMDVMLIQSVSPGQFPFDVCHKLDEPDWFCKIIEDSILNMKIFQKKIIWPVVYLFVIFSIT